MRAGGSRLRDGSFGGGSVALLVVTVGVCVLVLAACRTDLAIDPTEEPFELAGPARCLFALFILVILI